MAQNEAERGANQPSPPLCKKERSRPWRKTELKPEIPAGNADFNTETCKDVLRPKPPSVVGSAFGRGLRMDIVLHVEPTLNPLPWVDHCGDATVDVVISGTRTFWRDHRRLHEHKTRLALGWDPATKPKATTRSTETGYDLEAPLATVDWDSQAPLHPTFHTHSVLGDQESLELQQHARSWITTVEDWGGTGRKKPLHFRFEADWIRERGFGSCFVVLPSLSANGLLPGQYAAACAIANQPVKECAAPKYLEDALPILSDADPPTHGRVVLAMDQNTLSESTPEPIDYESVWRSGPAHEDLESDAYIAASIQDERHTAPVWTCLPTQDLSYLEGGEVPGVPPAGSYAGNACGAIAVVEPPAADEWRTAIILIGTIIGAILAEVSLHRWVGRRQAFLADRADRGV